MPQVKTAFVSCLFAMQISHTQIKRNHDTLLSAITFVALFSSLDMLDLSLFVPFFTSVVDVIWSWWPQALTPCHAHAQMMGEAGNPDVVTHATRSTVN